MVAAAEALAVPLDELLAGRVSDRCVHHRERVGPTEPFSTSPPECWPSVECRTPGFPPSDTPLTHSSCRRTRSLQRGAGVAHLPHVHESIAHHRTPRRGSVEPRIGALGPTGDDDGAVADMVDRC